MTKRLCFFFPFSPKPQHPFVSKAMPPPFVSPEFGAMFLVCELVDTNKKALGVGVLSCHGCSQV